jgi:hypothetical protein
MKNENITFTSLPALPVFVNQQSPHNTRNRPSRTERLGPRLDRSIKTYLKHYPLPPEPNQKIETSGIILTDSTR